MSEKHQKKPIPFAWRTFAAKKVEARSKSFQLKLIKTQQLRHYTRKKRTNKKSKPTTEEEKPEQQSESREWQEKGQNPPPTKKIKVLRSMRKALSISPPNTDRNNCATLPFPVRIKMSKFVLCREFNWPSVSTAGTGSVKPFLNLSGLRIAIIAA